MILFKARIFLLVDLQDFFSDLGSGDEKYKQKSSENDQITSFFFSFSELFFFLISPEKTVKLVIGKPTACIRSLYISLFS